MRIGLVSPVVTQVPGAHSEWERSAGIDALAEIAETADELSFHHLTCSEHVAVPAEVGATLPGTARRPARTRTIDPVTAGTTVEPAMTSTAERIARLEERLEFLEDEREVTRLVASYGPLVDSGSAEGVAALWEPDGVYDVDELVIHGRTEIVP